MRIRQATEADPPAIARVHVDSWRTTYRDLIPNEVLAGLSYEGRERMWRRFVGDPDASRFLLVAEEDGAVVGFAHGGPVQGGDNPSAGSGYDTELYAIYILQEFQGRGIGRALVRELARRLRDAGYRSLLLWVLEGNLARAFYERLGGVQAGRQEITRGGAVLPEVAYGWPDLRRLTQ